MGKNLKGKECGKGIRQRKDGVYSARFVDKGVHTLQLASALALGIIVATTFFNLLNHGRKTK